VTEALPRPQVVKVNRNAILRATPKDRYDLYAIALGNKLMTINEVRALEDLPKFNDPEFDKPGIPVLPGETPVPPPTAKPPRVI
jgi:hypothetical protein